jgi:hypothetical protein
MVRSPVEICLGTSPSQAAKSRPFVNASPPPIAATITLEMMGPIPGTLIKRSQPASQRHGREQITPRLAMAILGREAELLYDSIRLGGWMLSNSSFY